MNYRIVDVSHHNTMKSFKGVQGVMIRATYNKTKVDRKLAQHVKLAEKCGVPYGFYHYSYALNEKDAVAECRHFLKTIQKYSPKLPVAFDMEDADQYKAKRGLKLTSPLIADITYTFCDMCEKAGYYTMIYASDSTFANEGLKSEKLNRFAKWVATWRHEPTVPFKMWQYTNCYKNTDISAKPIDCSYANDTQYNTWLKFAEKFELTESGEPAMNHFLQVGDTVKILSRYDYNNYKTSAWILLAEFEVLKVSGDRIVVGRNGKITGAWNENDVAYLR